MKKAQLARCKNCAKVIMASIIPVSVDSAKEFAELMQEGHPLTIEWTGSRNWDFCDTKCDELKQTELALE